MLEVYVEQTMTGEDETPEQEEESDTEQSDGSEEQSDDTLDEEMRDMEEELDLDGDGEANDEAERPPELPPFVSDPMGKQEFETDYRVDAHEAEPYRFHVFRGEDGLVQQWVLMRFARVDGEEASVPVTSGSIPENGGGNAVWHEYHNRDIARRDEPENPTFVFTEREEVVPSNTFWRYINDVVSRLMEFEQAMDEMSSDQLDSLRVNPRYPEPYGELTEYEEHVANFFVQVVDQHKEMTDEMSEMAGIALRKFDSQHLAEE